MTKIAVILCAFLAACDVGDASNGQSKTDGGAGKMDGSGSGGGIDAAPIAAHSHSNPVNAGNPSNAGIGCMSPNCHGAVTPAGPQFGFAGTAYTTSGGGSPLVGAKVTVGSLNEVTDTAGNFYTYTTTITYPTNTSVAAGGKTSAMSGTISNGDCNSSGCHQSPGGSQGAIYLQ